MSRSLVPIDNDALSEQLALEENVLYQKLGELEGRIRHFEDFEQPAYERWVKLEFGPSLMTISQLRERLREKQILARRVHELIESKELSAREALYLALNHHDNQEVTARRRAKLEQKRTAKLESRREKKRNQQTETKRTNPETPTKANRLTVAYRALARKLHPDSAERIKELPASQLLNLWVEVQLAYQSSNYGQLTAISIWLEYCLTTQQQSIPKIRKTAVSFSERIEKIRLLTLSTTRLEKQLLELESHPAHIFSQRTQQRFNHQVARELDEQITKLQQDLDNITDFMGSIGTPTAPRAARRKH